MGRTLQNTMVNLALENACDEATYQVKRISDSQPIVPVLLKERRKGEDFLANLSLIQSVDIELY